MTSALPSLAFVFTDVVPRVWSPLVFPHQVCVCEDSSDSSAPSVHSLFVRYCMVYHKRVCVWVGGDTHGQQFVVLEMRVAGPAVRRAVLMEPDFFLLRTASKDRRKGPPTANRQPPPTANHQPPPTASGDQPPTANHYQPPPTTTNCHQPPVANCQPPIAANRQPPTATNHG